MLYLVVFVVIFLVGVVAKFFYPAVWEWFGLLDTASAVALAAIAIWGYFEYIRSEDVIKIYFDVDGQKIDTGLSILRKDFSRGELLGVLGMIQKKQVNRFELKELKDPAILKKIQSIQKGKDKEFILKISKDELDQFDLSDIA